MEESEFTEVSRAPLVTMYTVKDDYNFQDAACAEDELYYICWPTIAPSSIAYYRSSEIAEIDQSLLVTSLKLGTLYRVQVADAEGEPLTIPGELEAIHHSVDRYRRVIPGEDGTSLFLATDPSGNAMDDDGTPTTDLTNLGAILELTPKQE
jgi:glucose/arabinose dehydrogenase